MFPSERMTTAFVICPPGSMISVMSSTVPETEACTGAET